MGKFGNKLHCPVGPLLYSFGLCLSPLPDEMKLSPIQFHFSRIAHTVHLHTNLPKCDHIKEYRTSHPTLSSLPSYYGN